MNAFFLTLLSVQVSLSYQMFRLSAFNLLILLTYVGWEPKKNAYRKRHPSSTVAYSVSSVTNSSLFFKYSDFQTSLYSLPMHLDLVAWFSAVCSELVHDVPIQDN